MRNKIVLTLSLLAAIAATAAIARPPGPDQIGEFYYYFDKNGQVVGNASLDCQGNYYESGIRTNFYSNGYAICNPNW